ncbi:MucB/RseB C-terminal domain-containing protein [Marinobacterium lutimaris]|uniref:Anti sigma-E protein RseA, N-terminal domain n=1 Tax=Marinobacterium lutimaris TaxID=568106 RepID=A0A1H6CIH9_9GAMM|nr:MucB/RseB C-terminal domain-containing protein [Marinobacterium lutimaris]SEG72784.1 Anti sigma-E protein RseA, N-terminal domain [Marinobacterium lutimaris]
MSEWKEGLSALMDDQASDFELRRLLDRAGDTPEVGQTWQRYQLTRSVLKGEPVAARDDLSISIAAALESEPTYSGKTDSIEAKAPSWLSKASISSIGRSVASMAVAASVTAVVILGANNFGVGTGTDSVDGAVAQSDASTNRPAQTIAARTPISNDLVRTQFGDSSRIVNTNTAEPDVIRLSQGLSRYIDQHEQLLGTRQPEWTSAWLPDGFKPVRHDLMPHGEVIMYSNGESAFSVTIEPKKDQQNSEGVAQSDGLIALGRNQGSHFITVVGDIPLMIADRIASNVKQIR